MEAISMEYKLLWDVDGEKTAVHYTMVVGTGDNRTHLPQTRDLEPLLV